MSIEYYLCAWASYHSYLKFNYVRKLQLPPGWKVIDPNPCGNGNNHGYYGIALINDHEKKCIIAHRGTDPKLLTNLISDAQIALRYIPLAHNEAKIFSDDLRRIYSGYIFIESGHSLGGGHALINTVYAQSNAKYNQQGNYCICFDPPGVAGIFSNETLINIDQNKFTTFVSAPNIINTVGIHLGKKIRVYTDYINQNENGKILLKAIQHLLPEQIGRLPWIASFLMFLGYPLTIQTLSITALLTLISSIVVDDNIWSNLNQHAMNNFFKSFNSDGIRHGLMAGIKSWPSFIDNISYNLSCTAEIPTFLLESTLFDGANRTHRVEESLIKNMKKYVIEEFIISDNINQLSAEKLREFCMYQRKQFDIYFTNYHLKSIFKDTFKLKIITKTELTPDDFEYCMSELSATDTHEPTVPIKLLNNISLHLFGSSSKQNVEVKLIETQQRPWSTSSFVNWYLFPERRALEAANHRSDELEAVQSMKMDK